MGSDAVSFERNLKGLEALSPGLAARLRATASGGGVSIVPSKAVVALNMFSADALAGGHAAATCFKLFSAEWTRLFDNALPVRLALMTQRKLTGYDAAIAFRHEPDSRSRQLRTSIPLSGGRGGREREGQER